MSYKKTVVGAASALALTLALAQPALGSPVTTDAPAPAAVAAAAEPAPAAATPAPQPPAATAPEATPAAPPAAATAGTPPALPEPPALPPELAARQAEHERLMAMTPEERWEARRAELNRRYADLRQRAAEAGMELPEQAPWDRTPPPATAKQPPSAPGWGPGKGPGRMLMSPEERQAIREKLRGMTPEQRRAFHEQHYQEMRERAAAQGMELPERPPWAGADAEPPAAPQPPAAADAPGTDWPRLKETLGSMSPEQLEACMMMHRLPGPMAMPRHPAAGYGYGPGYGPGPGYGRGAGAPPGWQPWGGYGQ
jgi:hypothetical protein